MEIIKKLNLYSEYYFRLICESNWRREQKDIVAFPLDNMTPWWLPLLYLFVCYFLL